MVLRVLRICGWLYKQFSVLLMLFNVEIEVSEGGYIV